MAVQFDVIVVGAGHAGYEAALASARVGARTALVTISRDSIARMSCNPSIGGMAKSHIVFELDALGGEIARNTDYTGIQFRVLNTRKGPAVQANRAQCDKDAFPRRMIAVLESTSNLEIVEALVTGLSMVNGRLAGVVIEGDRLIPGKAVVLATGTFLRGKIYIGHNSVDGGRIGERAACGLSDSLRNLGFRLGRLKTGTPPRLHKDSIDCSKMRVQQGLEPPPFFSRAVRKEWEMFHVEQGSVQGPESVVQSRGNERFTTSGHPSLPTSDVGHWTLDPEGMFHVEQSPFRPWIPGSDQLPCYLTHTTPETHRIIADNLKTSALYGGLIEGTGVRYCPSIEDKIVKFPQHDAHHIFIEPEGRHLDEVYPNGTSNSLPEDVQVEMIHSIPGLERARFIRPGYAIEYDFSDPTQLYHSLETKLIQNLYFAGQINGTTGYEEAAGQGFVAGVNAARTVMGQSPLVLSRNEAYLGVLIDDLVTKGTDEPYRMFTSRAEHRLLLRQDNTALRLRHHAKELGIVPKKILDEIEEAGRQIEAEVARLRASFSDGASLAQILRRPGMSYAALPGRHDDLPGEVTEQVEVNIKYEGYIDRELRQIAQADSIERQRIPSWVDYDEIRALRFESREKLKKIQPENLGQASRISGVNPADIAILQVWIKRNRPEH